MSWMNVDKELPKKEGSYQTKPGLRKLYFVIRENRWLEYNSETHLYEIPLTMPTHWQDTTTREKTEDFKMTESSDEESDASFLEYLNFNYSGWDTYWESLDDVPKEIIEQAGKDLDDLIQGFLNG